jgi:hypothetical protein
MRVATTTMYVLGAVSLLLSLYIGVLVYLAFHMLGTYRAWQTLVEFICVLFFLMGLLFLYLSIYGLKYKEVAKVDKAMPDWVPNALLGISIFSVLVAIFGYVASYTESCKILQLFSIVCGLFTAGIIILAIGAALYKSKFQDYFENKCTEILDFINQDYLIKYGGCAQKYVFNSTSISGMKCPKDRIVTYWEVNLGVDVDKQINYYGCIDEECCLSTYSTIKSKINYVALIAFILFIFGCLMVGGSCYMLSQLEQGVEFGESPKEVRYTLITIIAIAVIIMVILISNIPTPPTPSPTSIAEVNVAPSNNSQANSSVIVIQTNSTVVTDNANQQVVTNANQNTTVAVDTSGCGNNCLELKYYYVLSSNDGIFQADVDKIQSNNINITRNEKQNDGWVVEFNGGSSILQGFTEFFTFVHNCPLEPATVYVQAKAVAYNPNDQPAPATSFTQLRVRQVPPLVSNNSVVNVNTDISATVIDVSKLKDGDVIQVLDKTLDYSYVGLDTQIIIGNVVQVIDLQTTSPIQGANVSITPVNFPQCGVNTYQTASDGSFRSDQFYVLNGDIPTEYKVDISYPNFVTYSRTEIVGGIGYQNTIDMGTISLWPINLKENVNISSDVLNSVNNQPLDGVTVQLLAGYIAFQNQQTDSDSSVLVNQNSQGGASFLQIKTNKKHKSKKIKQNNNQNANNQTANIQTPNNQTANNQTASDDTVDQPLNITVNTDENGTYTFTGLPPNTYTLLFEKNGFYTEILCKFI